jgi:hypothetical protein
VRRRNAELSEIAKSIAQLADLFKDLSALVIDQGTLLDSVEYNIEQTSVHMAEAVHDLDVATKLVSDNRSTPAELNVDIVWQVPEEHGSAEVHLSAPSDHLWPHRCSHLQAPPSSFLARARPYRHRNVIACALVIRQALAPHPPLKPRIGGGEPRGRAEWTLAGEPVGSLAPRERATVRERGDGSAHRTLALRRRARGRLLMVGMRVRKARRCPVAAAAIDDRATLGRSSCNRYRASLARTRGFIIQGSMS